MTKRARWSQTVEGENQFQKQNEAQSLKCKEREKDGAQRYALNMFLHLHSVTETEMDNG